MLKAERRNNEYFARMLRKECGVFGIMIRSFNFNTCSTLTIAVESGWEGTNV